MLIIVVFVAANFTVAPSEPVERELWEYTKANLEDLFNAFKNKDWSLFY